MQCLRPIDKTRNRDRQEAVDTRLYASIAAKPSQRRPCPQTRFGTIRKDAPVYRPRPAMSLEPEENASGPKTLRSFRSSNPFRDASDVAIVGAAASPEDPDAKPPVRVPHRARERLRTFIRIKALRVVQVFRAST